MICMAFVRSICVDLLKTLCAILVFIYPMDFNMALGLLRRIRPNYLYLFTYL